MYICFFSIKLLHLAKSYAGHLLIDMSQHSCDIRMRCPCYLLLPPLLCWLIALSVVHFAGHVLNLIHFLSSWTKRIDQLVGVGCKPWIGCYICCIFCGRWRQYIRSNSLKVWSDLIKPSGWNWNCANFWVPFKLFEFQLWLKVITIRLVKWTRKFSRPWKSELVWNTAGNGTGQVKVKEIWREWVSFDVVRLRVTPFRNWNWLINDGNPT